MRPTIDSTNGSRIGSTEQPPVDLSRPWQRNPRVGFRTEAFGGLAYHYDTRKLMFCKSAELVDLVNSLHLYPSAFTAIDSQIADRSRHMAYRRALESLATNGLISELADSEPSRSPAADAPAVPASSSDQLPALTPSSTSAPTAAPTARQQLVAKAHEPLPTLSEQLSAGLDSPICLTWELTYACNLACVHCLSSSGRRNPAELSLDQVKSVIDDLARMSVFYVNFGGGEPMIRRDFNEIADYCTQSGIGVKFSTNGTFLDAKAARRFAENDLVDIQISLDGFDEQTNDAVRGPGSWRKARAAMDALAEAGLEGFKISIVATRHNFDQLDDYVKLAEQYNAQLRVTRLRPSGRGVDSYHDLRLTNDQQFGMFHWLMAHPEVLTGDSFFHLNAAGSGSGERLAGLSMCGASRIVCLIDPIGDVYACPFVIHDKFKAGNVLNTGGFKKIWREAELFDSFRSPQSNQGCKDCVAFDACGGGCMAAKFFTGIPLHGPDPDCLVGNADHALVLAANNGEIPRPSQDHSAIQTWKPVLLKTRR